VQHKDLSRRGDAGLDQVQQDSSDLRGIGDDGKHLHGGAAAAAAKGVPSADLGQQPGPGGAGFLGGDGRLSAILGGPVGDKDMSSMKFSMPRRRSARRAASSSSMARRGALRRAMSPGSLIG
jgi:hypothetical protein